MGALELDHLHFGYGRHATVRGVSLRVEPGDCYGFLGHNGAGKTTVMRLCLGLLRPSSGQVRIFGVDAARQRRRANSLVGALIERPGFHGNLSARQNLAALAKLQGVPHKLASVEVERVIETVGLSDAIDQRAGTFSMGMRQRLGIAQAILGRPRLLLLDEPTNGLDPEGMAELRALLHRLTRDEGVAVLLSSHQLAELEGLCNRVGVLRDGEMIAEGDLDTLRRHVGVRYAVTGEPLGALQQRLELLGMRPAQDGDRLLVELGDHAAGEVTKALSASGELTSFAPEQATLERIYLQAAQINIPSPTEAEVQAPTTGTPRPSMGSADLSGLRALLFESHSLLRRRATLPLLTVPCAAAAFAVHRYQNGVQAGLARVEAGESFSADAGSGYLAVAQGMQAATPCLTLALLWFASQSIAADVAGDTLRNTLVRSLRRQDVLTGKLMVLLSTCLLGWTASLATAVGVSWLKIGFGDLEEVFDGGDRDVLAEAADVAPTMWLAAAQMLLPLGAVVLVATAASTLVRRPAMALALATAFLLGPDLMRLWIPEHSGWLLTSHLPSAWRDDSALNYLAATARGAADALWLYADLAVWAPLSWAAAATIALSITFQRMRIS